MKFKRNSVWIRRMLGIISAVLSVCLVLLTCAYVCYHSANIFNEKYITGTVGEGSVRMSVRLKAAFFRDDEVIRADFGATGIVRSMFEGGEKVPADSEIARVYTDLDMSPEDAENLSESIDKVNKEIAFLKKCLDLRHTTYYVAGSNVEVSYKNFIMGLSKSDCNAISDSADKLLFDLNRFGVIRGGASELEDRIAILESQRSSMLERYAGNYVSCVTEKGGYFFPYTEIDGYEDTFTLSTLKSINADSLRAMMESKPANVPDDAVGKMTFSHTRKIAAIADADICRSLEIGKEYYVKYDSYNSEIPITLERIAAAINGEGVLVFSCNVMPNDFTYNRISEITLYTDVISGLKVPETAIYICDDVRGIYVLKKGSLVFKRADVLYEKDGVCLIAEEPSDLDENYTGLPYPKYNDIIIISGKDLYEGKVLG